MALVAIDNQTGQLGSAIGANDTTIPMGSAWTGATVASPNYVRLLIDPSLIGVRNPSYEAVYATVINGNATATVIANGRGKEGTTAVAHASHANWCCGASAQDVATNPSAIWSIAASPNLPIASGATYSLDDTGLHIVLPVAARVKLHCDSVVIFGANNGVQAVTANFRVDASDVGSPIAYVYPTGQLGGQMEYPVPFGATVDLAQGSHIIGFKYVIGGGGVATSLSQYYIDVVSGPAGS